MFKSLSGARTYICALILILVAGVHALGYMNDALYQTLYAIFGGAGLMALRAAVR